MRNFNIETYEINNILEPGNELVIRERYLQDDPHYFANMSTNDGRSYDIRDVLHLLYLETPSSEINTVHCLVTMQDGTVLIGRFSKHYFGLKWTQAL